MALDTTVASSDLGRALSAAEKAVSRKPSLPVLGNVLVAATRDAIQLTATDLDIAIVSRYGAQTLEDGAVTLPAATLGSLVRSLPPTEVRLSESNGTVTLSAAGFKARLQTLPTADFPSVAAVPSDGGVMLSREWFRDAVLRTRFATKEGDTRFFLAGAQLEVAATRTRLVATDAYRLAIADGPPCERELPSAILPTKTLHALATLLDGDGDDVVYSRGENHLFFAIGGHMLVSRVIDGQYPNYERIVPLAAEHWLEGDRETLLAAVRRATLVMDQTVRKATFSLDGGTVRVSTDSASVGSASEAVAVHYAGPPVFVNLNADYVKDFLEAAATPSVQLSVTAEDKGVIWSAVGGPVAYRYTMMPVRS